MRDRRADRHLEPDTLDVVDPADDLPVLRVAGPESELAGVGGRVCPDRVRARHEPGLADPARALAPQARPGRVTVYHFVTTSSHARRPRCQRERSPWR